MLKPANPTPAVTPAPTPRTRLTGTPIEPLSVPLKTVTPIFGGGTLARHVDQVDVIRVPSIRGHLRFWWRALHAFRDAKTLGEHEQRLWGGVSGGEPRRSEVELTARVVGHEPQEPIATDVNPNEPGGYALWPAREERERGRVKTPAGERWRSVGWQLAITAPKDDLPQVRRAVQAWILFGGYGGRTRRGCGSLTVTDRKAAFEWLPAQASLAAIEKLLGAGTFNRPESPPNDMPRLAGACVFAGQPSPDAQACWDRALAWLKEFRQAPGPTGAHAREPGTGRPGPSRWPEPDKLRHRAGRGPWHRPPRHNAVPVWPRASFGLPIVNRFQDKSADKTPYDPADPDGQFELVWCEGEGAPAHEHDRLASPLILKPLALGNGHFVPVALWLYRAYPAGGRVRLKGDPDSEADFDQLRAPADVQLYDPLKNPKALAAAQGERMKTAFLDWLEETGRARRIV